MTKKEKDFLHQQLIIIQNKIDDDALNRYATLLSVAVMSKEVKDFLKRACDMRYKEMNPIDPIAVNGDLDDIN